MTKKIFNAILLAVGVVLLSSFAVIAACLYGYMEHAQEAQLRDGLDLAAAAVEDSGLSCLEKIDSDRFRFTWVAADGTVLYDTFSGGPTAENHGDREEIRQALEEGEGRSVRYSDTLAEKTLYCARRLADGTVLRISVSRSLSLPLALRILLPLLLISAGALILSAVLASRLSRRIMEPINSLDLEHPLENQAYPELSPLLTRLDCQRQELSSQLRRLQQKADEFAQVTASMNEGLVLLNEQGTILSINPAAARLFGADASCVGQDFFTISGTLDLSPAIRCALTEGHSEIHAERDGREYQFDISRIESEHGALGAVLLAFDVTDQEYAQRNRREFTANVSHELKTPLQGIIGSAELIETGLVKPEDLPRFVGHIRQEASRLVALIEDIIRLSQLDEGGELPREDTDLLEVAREAAGNLQGAALARRVSLSVDGSPVSIPGVRRLLYEIVYNLCDNGIKYNAEGGHVWITVSAEEKEAVLTVKDTGIGIAPEHQSRVFERFYRVDKSHSKASGGTGLGLSIVKHAVQYHRGRLELSSHPGKGTCVTVRLPRQ